MKPKELIGLVVALVVIVAAGAVLLGQNKPRTANLAANQYEVVPVISAQLDSQHLLDNLDTKYKVHDYKLPISLDSGLGNPAPFGQ